MTFTLAKKYVFYYKKAKKKCEKNQRKNSTGFQKNSTGFVAQKKIHRFLIPPVLFDEKTP